MAPKATKKTPSTQKYLNIAEIRDDCIVMKDGTLRSVLMVSSVNFALKSEDEQNAIIASYISFLNSLNSPLQILIQSRELDLDNYVAELKVIEKEQKNELLQLQTAEYRQYITELIELGNIMSKHFYVVVPYDPLSSKKRSFWKRANDILSPIKIIKLNERNFTERRKSLFLLTDKILSGLSSMGLRATVLNTQSLIELLYNTYNPTVSKTEKLVELNKLRLDE